MKFRFKYSALSQTQRFIATDYFFYPEHVQIEPSEQAQWTRFYEEHPEFRKAFLNEVASNINPLFQPTSYILPEYDWLELAASYGISLHTKNPQGYGALWTALLGYACPLHTDESANAYDRLHHIRTLLNHGLDVTTPIKALYTSTDKGIINQTYTMSILDWVTEWDEPELLSLFEPYRVRAVLNNMIDPQTLSSSLKRRL